MNINDPLERLAREREQAPKLRTEFRDQLEQLDAALIEVGEQVTGLVGPSTEAFLQADAARAQELRVVDQRVGQRCTLLEDRCYVLIARESPVADDLRRVVAVHRSIADVQRSSNLLRHVVESLTWVHPPSMSADIRDLVARLGAVAEDLFARGVDAWRTHDALASAELDRADDQADLAQKELLAELYTGTQSVEDSVSLALIARYYERVADHGVELAHNVAYVVTGQRPGRDAIDV